MPIDRAELGVPAALALAAIYTREVRVGIGRIWENVLDWEHLPALHGIYFDDVALLEIGSWGWRVELTKTPGMTGRRMVVELRIDQANARYRARTLAGDGAGTEIWTLLRALGPQRTAVEVHFYLPEHRPDRLAALCEKYRSSQACLWDQDEAMMMRREALSTRSRTGQKASRKPLALGPLRELRQRLPLCVEVDGEPFRLLELEDGSSLTARFARTGSDRSRRPCRRMASCAVLGTVICSMSGPARAPTDAAIDWRRRRSWWSIR
jgi:hypothetical protein